MSTHFIKAGNQYRLTSKNNLNIQGSLPLGTYSVNFDPNRGEFYLETISDFSFNEKRYGDIESKAARVINTFLERPQNTGVLLNGEKGSGKTLLAKVVSQTLRESYGISTLIINSQFSGEGFNNFIALIEEPVLVMFDEFEKVYGEDAQEDLLTLFDGTRGSKKLFVVTANEGYSISKYMYNRPGRIFYLFDYKGLEEDFIVEYCKDFLSDQKKISDILRFSRTFKAFNFDMLKALVEELNRYGESVEDAVNFLNIKPTGRMLSYLVKSSTFDGVKELEGYKWSKLDLVNPYVDTFYIRFKEPNDNSIGLVSKDDSKSNKRTDFAAMVTPDNIIAINDDGSIDYKVSMYINSKYQMIDITLVPITEAKKQYTRMMDFMSDE